MKHHHRVASEFDALISCFRQPRAVGGRVIYDAGLLSGQRNIMLFPTCHRLSIRFPEVCWYQSVGKRGRIVQDHHQQGHQVYHEQIQHVFDYANPATLWRLWVALDSDPAQHNQSVNFIRWIGQLTGTRDGNASSVILAILFIKFIAAVLDSSASSRKLSRTSNVNAVLGFLKIAGKSFARRRSWTYWSADLAQ